MKPVFAKVLEGLENEVFATRLITRPFFTTEFHFHAECQITYIVKSSGHKVIGDCVENFEPGELILLGSYIPHVWYNSSTKPAKREQGEAARSVALFFHPDKLVTLLSSFFSTKKLEAVLEVAKRGMKFHGAAREQLKVLLLKMAQLEPGPQQLMLLLEMVQLLTNVKEYTLLAGTGYTNTYTNKDSEKMDRLFKYVFDNYSREISLDEAAALIHMNKQAFCRYFKGRTQKTFVEFVNEVRITAACKLLSAGEESVGNIAYQCGFNSLTNFNRFFKKIKNVSPLKYKSLLAE
ncbi:AraC family transcriptional regulator [Chitinophaga sp. Cy-1792]|uniref:AraC family transcriptional regulator n=1 Tax=Chitinophaga sp. Cy-1792 TaxID=2608339 RepID=UPI00141E00DF|nr:AraC family transcriptional regulator [Chitinophaga sp. Cy-1792]NIG54489.1 AraC family transcriptional regulator [Chitinophaga sp. Cy-1792]